jgi:hypothetical protein
VKLDVDSILTIVTAVATILGADRWLAGRLGAKRDRLAAVLRLAREAAREVAELLIDKEITAGAAILRWESRFGRLTEALGLTEAERQAAHKEAAEYLGDLALRSSVAELRAATRAFRQGFAEIEAQVRRLP